VTFCGRKPESLILTFSPKREKGFPLHSGRKRVRVRVGSFAAKRCGS